MSGVSRDRLETVMDDEQWRHYSNKLAYEIDSWDLKVALEGGEKVVVVDTRSAEAFSQEHIPGAVSLPHREMTDEATRSIDKSRLVVTYCDGIGCNASTKGALNMTKLGFRVKELMGGLDWWKRDGHPTEGQAAGARRNPACNCD
jgi:rhodanese-related sulfurtransferase